MLSTADPRSPCPRLAQSAYRGEQRVDPPRGSLSSVPGGRRGPIRSQAAAVASASRGSSTRAGAHSWRSPGSSPRRLRVPLPRRPPTTIRPKAALRPVQLLRVVQCRTDAGACRIPQESIRVVFLHRQRTRPKLSAPDSADSEYSDAGQRHHHCQALVALASSLLQEFFEPHSRRQ